MGKEKTMYEQLLNKTEKLLEEHPGGILPIKKVWSIMVIVNQTESVNIPDSLADFECLLEGDMRFVLLQKDDIDVTLAEKIGEDFFEYDKMEKMSFTENELVQLRKYYLLDEEEYAEREFAPHNAKSLKKKSKNPKTKK